MVNCAVLACIDDICHKIMDNTQPFGGKIIILLGDFQQTCLLSTPPSKIPLFGIYLKSGPSLPRYVMWTTQNLHHGLTTLAMVQALR